MIAMRKEEVRALHLHTKKFRVSKLNTYKTFAYAVTYLKMLSAAHKLHRTNRQYVKYNLRFYFCFCFSKNLPLPPPNPPLLCLSYWPTVSVTVTTKLKQLSTWYVRQYSTVSNYKGNNIICNMTVFCDELETNIFEVPIEWSERKSHNNTSVCTVAMFLQSDKCNNYLSLCTSWEHMGESRYSCTHY